MSAHGHSLDAPRVRRWTRFFAGGNNTLMFNGNIIRKWNSKSSKSRIALLLPYVMRSFRRRLQKDFVIWSPYFVSLELSKQHESATNCTLFVDFQPQLLVIRAQNKLEHLHEWKYCHTLEIQFPSHNLLFRGVTTLAGIPSLPTESFSS